MMLACRRLGTPAGGMARPAFGRGRALAPLVVRRSFATVVPPTPSAVQQPVASAASAAGAAVAAPPAAAAVPRAVGWWLLGCSASVFGMVVLGGYTRLTRSGLSMVDWRPQGSALPSDESAWQAEFERYKAFPEYQRTNRDMDLEGFKQIYFVEWAHRMAGRAIGVLFALPLAGFAAAGMVPLALAPRLGCAFALGGAQGLIGWWMVRSGLEEPPADLDGVPRVSPYRLATHLAMAFTIYSLLLSTALTVLWPAPLGGAPGGARALGAARALRGPAHALAGLIAITALSGAFVAGMGAGYAYNTFPLMEGKWVPDGYWRIEPAWRNLFENIPAVQFDHRALAMSTLGGTVALWAYARTLPLPRPVRLATHGVLAVTCAQASLGIWTLLAAVPVELGTAHQAGALTLFSAALVLLHTLRKLPRC